MKNHTLFIAQHLSINYGKVDPSPLLMLAITPRWVLHHFHSSNPHADKIKSQIRERLMPYDQTTPHPDLKWYGHQDNFEWKQYFYTR